MIRGHETSEWVDDLQAVRVELIVKKQVRVTTADGKVLLSKYVDDITFQVDERGELSYTMTADDRPGEVVWERGNRTRRIAQRERLIADIIEATT